MNYNFQKLVPYILFIWGIFLGSCSNQQKASEEKISDSNLSPSDSLVIDDPEPSSYDEVQLTVSQLDSPQTQITPPKKAQLSFGELKSFTLDSKTSFYSQCLQFKKMRDGKSILFSFNEAQNAIYAYDFEGGGVAKIIKLQNQGPDDVGAHVKTFLVHSWDSIFVLSDYTMKISLIDSSSKKKASYIARDEDRESSIYPIFGGTNRPLNLYKGKIIFTGFYYYWLFPENKEPALVSVDLKKSTIGGYFHYPKRIFTALYGRNGGYLEYAFNPEKSLVVLNQGTTDSLIVGDLRTGKQKNVYAKSSFFNTIKPLDKDSDAKVDQQKWQKYDVQGQVYGAIFYDKKNKLYYRIGFDSKDMLHPTHVIVILNDKFEIVGQQMLPKDVYFPTMCFTNEKGMYLARKDLYNKDEEHLVFQLIVPTYE